MKGGIRMVIWTAKLSKGKTILSVLTMGVMIGIVILWAGREPQETIETEQPVLTSNEERVAYLQSWGWEVSAEPVATLQFQMPEVLTEPYLSYNELQEPLGFDLTSCCGKQLERYTYEIRNYPGRTEGVQVNLYLCEGVPAAGDICSSGADGFQQGLAYPSDENESAA